MGACKEKEEGGEEGRTGAGAVKREGRSGTEGKFRRLSEEQVGSYPPNQVNDSKKGSNGAAGCRSGNLHSERGEGSGLAGAPYPESSEVPSG